MNTLWNLDTVSSRTLCTGYQSQEGLQTLLPTALVSKLPRKTQCSQVLDRMMLYSHRGETEQDELQKWAVWALYLLVRKCSRSRVHFFAADWGSKDCTHVTAFPHESSIPWTWPSHIQCFMSQRQPFSSVPAVSSVAPMYLNKVLLLWILDFKL